MIILATARRVLRENNRLPITSSRVSSDTDWPIFISRSSIFPVGKARAVHSKFGRQKASLVENALRLPGRKFIRLADRSAVHWRFYNRDCLSILSSPAAPNLTRGWMFNSGLGARRAEFNIREIEKREIEKLGRTLKKRDLAN